MGNLSAKTGFTPVQTRITLANNAATTVQNFSAYDAQELTGFVFIDATTDYRASVKVQVVKNGAGTYEVAAADIAGDDNGGNPIVSFSMSGANLQATLVSYAGYVTAYIQFSLNAPALGGQFPLSVDSSNIAFTDIKASTGSGVNFKEDGGTTVGSFSDSGAWTFGPSTHTGSQTFYGQNIFIGTNGAGDETFFIKPHNDKKRLWVRGDTATNAASVALIGKDFGGTGTGGQVVNYSADIAGAASTNKAHLWYSYPTVGGAVTEVGSATGAGAWTFGATGTSGIQHKLNGGADTNAETSSVVRIRNVGAPNSSTSANMVSFLDINGDVQGSITINPSANTTAYNTSSDARLKTGFEEFDGIEIIKAMNPTRYERVSCLGVKEYGLVAQDLFQIYPQAVVVGGEDANTDPWLVDYSKVVPILIKAIQELKAEIDILKGNK